MTTTHRGAGNPMKFIGIDYGIKRIGLAQGDDDTRIAFPLDTIAGRNDVTRDARNVADRGAANVKKCPGA